MYQIPNSQKKAKSHANEVLPVEPRSLVEQYLAGKERQSKEDNVANRWSRFSKPALPVSKERESTNKPCACKGECATRKLDCLMQLRWCVVVNANGK